MHFIVVVPQKGAAKWKILAYDAETILVLKESCDTICLHIFSKRSLFVFIT